MEEVGYGALYLMLDRDFLMSKELTITAKVVYGYLNQMAPYRYPGETGAELLAMSENDFANALAELHRKGYLTDNEYKTFTEEGI